MEAQKTRKEQVLALKTKVCELDRKIQGLMPDGFTARSMRYKGIPYGHLDEKEYDERLSALKSELDWATKTNPRKVLEIKNKVLEFVAQFKRFDVEKFHEGIDPLLDEKLELVWKIHELELEQPPSPGGVHDGGHGEDDLPRKRQRDLGALEPAEPADL